MQNYVDKNILYARVFETQFITLMAQYINKVGESWLNDRNSACSLAQVLAQLDVISDRVKSVISLEDSAALIVRECHKAILLAQRDYFLSLSSDALEEENWFKVGSLYKLIKPLAIDSTSFPILVVSGMHAQFREHLKDKLYKVLSVIIKDDNLNFMCLIENFAKFHQKYSDVVEEACQGDKGFREDLNAVMSQVINKAPYTVPAAICVQYIDNLLIKSNKVSSDWHTKHIYEVADIVGFVEDKDTFKILYTNALAKRLIYSKFTLDQEEVLIDKLSKSFDWQYTARLRKMVNDISGNILTILIILLLTN